ncbi:VanZ family protein [Desulfotomaculum defluvii]
MHRVTNGKVILSWVFVVLWMVLIFTLSAQPAEQSNGLSKGLTAVIVETIQKVAPESDFDIGIFNHVVRKNAHFFAYLVLGVLLMNVFRKSGVKGLRGYGLALAICVLYAASDEVHQLFVPGRGGQIRDVLLDSTGALVGIGIYWSLSRNVKIMKQL